MSMQDSPEVAESEVVSGVLVPAGEGSLEQQWAEQLLAQAKSDGVKLVERGVEVDHVTVYRWVQRFMPLLAHAARLRRHSPGDRWYVGETYVRVNGVWRYVYRAVDQHGQVIELVPQDG